PPSASNWHQRKMYTTLVVNFQRRQLINTIQPRASFFLLDQPVRWPNHEMPNNSLERLFGSGLVHDIHLSGHKFSPRLCGSPSPAGRACRVAVEAQAAWLLWWDLRSTGARWARGSCIRAVEGCIEV